MYISQNYFFHIIFLLHTLRSVNNVTECSTQEGHRCFVEKWAEWFDFSVKLALKKTMGASWVLPTMNY